MKNLLKALIICFTMFLCLSCDERIRSDNQTALLEQQQTETNQKTLFSVQPPPKLSWSLERDNLIKRFKLMNDRTIMFYMYVFIEGQSDPIGYYQVNKVSSVNSQLTNPEQIINGRDQSNDIPSGIVVTIPSPAEDGSYGTNGDGVFGFTPEDIYIEHNMKYIIASVPLSFAKPVNLLTVINLSTEKQLKAMMQKIK